jgi:hypothetical protein
MPDATTLLSRWLEPVGQALNDDAARRILDLRVDDEMQARVDELADRNTEGLLTPDERSEYEALIAIAAMINVMKGKARARFATHPTAA